MYATTRRPDITYQYERKGLERKGTVEIEGKTLRMGMNRRQVMEILARGGCRRRRRARGRMYSENSVLRLKEKLKDGRAISTCGGMAEKRPLVEHRVT